MLQQSRPRHCLCFWFPFRISHPTGHGLSRCCNWSNVLVCPAPCLPRRDGLRVLQKDATSRGARSRQAIAVAWRLPLAAKRFPPRTPLENVLFRFLTTKQTQRGFRPLAVKLPLLCPNTATKKFMEIISLLGWYLGTVHRVGCGKLVDACRGFDHVAASVTRFSQFGKTQSLPDLMEPPAFRSVQQSQVRSILSREEGWRLPVPTHPLRCAVCCSHWSNTHLSTIRVAAPHSLKLRKGLWSLLSQAS